MARVLHELVADALLELAVAKVQRRLWLSDGARGAEVSSLDECDSRLWDDSGLGDALDKDEPVYAPETDESLRQLRALLRRIDRRMSPQELFNDPRLMEARSMAAALCRELRDVGPDLR